MIFFILVIDFRFIEYKVLSVSIIKVIVDLNEIVFQYFLDFQYWPLIVTYMLGNF